MKNVLKLTVLAAIALIVSVALNINIKQSEKAVDLAALKSANAWTWCVDWSPENVGKEAWFIVTHNFPASEIARIDAQYPQYGILANNRKICLLGGWEICVNYDIGVSQLEVSQHQFGEFTYGRPM